MPPIRLWGFFLVPALIVSIVSAAKPNVIYILADDLGYGEVGFNGQQKIETPELDRLAANGMRFTSHYCGTSVCAPTRCSLLTGLHTGHCYIRANSPGYPNGQMPLPPNTETVGKLMQRAGYRTACIGKWGLGGFHNSGNPNEQGFDHFFGYTDQRKAHNYFPEYLWRNGEKVNLEGRHYSHDLLTEEAIEFVKAHKDQPFFLYLAYCIPHVKYQVPDLAQYADLDWPKNMKIHAAMTSRMDRDIGRIERLIQSLGLSSNTLIIFNSDNGAHGKDKSVSFLKTTGNLRGIKRSMFEGGVRSPMVAYWPGTISPKTVSDHISAFWDFLPTMAELTGEPVRGESDGISMLPTLLGEPQSQKKHDYLYWELYEGKPNQAVLMGNWKAVVADRRTGMEIQLFDLRRDPAESTNVADKYPEIVARCRQAMNESHTPSPFWDANNKPLFNVSAARNATGLRPVRKPKKDR